MFLGCPLGFFPSLKVLNVTRNTERKKTAVPMGMQNYTGKKP